MTRAVLRFWGVRGSIPVPGPGTLRYGGNTACVAITSDDDHTLVFDAGSGLRPLGLMLAAREAPCELDLLLSHTHLDHIHGLPLFLPAYRETNRIRIHGPAQDRGLREVLERQMSWEMFPIPPSAQAGLVAVTEVDTGRGTVGPWDVHATPLCHPGRTLGYRVARPGVRPLAYVTDNELSGGVHGVARGWREGLVDFLEGVHTLIHDCTWSDDQLPAMTGWGHSSAGQAARLALEAGCARLVLFHHDPDRDDAGMDALVESTRVAAPGLEVLAAVEGQTLELEATE